MAPKTLRPPAAGHRLAPTKLQALGYRVDWHQYPMPHSVCPDEVADIEAFLKRVLATA